MPTGKRLLHVCVAVGLLAPCLRAQPLPTVARIQEMQPPASRHTLHLNEVLKSVERVHPLLIAASKDVDVATAESLSAEGAFDTSWKTKGTARPVGYYDAVTVDSTLEQPTSLWGITPFAGYRLGVNDFPIYDEKY